MTTPFPLEQKLGDYHFEIALATAKDRQAVLKLRYDAFKREMNYDLKENPNNIDQDQYDEYCDHLIVRDLATAEIVGTYRLLQIAMAKKHNGLYSENEFDLSCLYTHNINFVEIGRACTHKEYRGQMIISLLWTGLYRYCEHHRIEYLGGCTTIGDSAEHAADIYHYVKHINALADENLFPITANKANKVVGLDLSHPPKDMNAVKHSLPPLLRAYLSIGGILAPEPAYDPDWRVIDFFTLLQFDKNARRILRFFGSG